MSRSDLNISRWLDAHSDRSAGIKTLPDCVILSDVAGDGDNRLVLADFKFENDTSSRLKVYKGTLLVTDQPLPDIPSGLISFYSENMEHKVPVIGVACGLELLIYKNNKPFFKFTPPSLPVLNEEAEAWKNCSENKDYTNEQFIEVLKSLSFIDLSPRSQTLLSLDDDEVIEYIAKFLGKDLKRQSPIVCVTTINKNNHEENSPACCVVATEAGQIYFLDPRNFSILHQASVAACKATPFIIKAEGLFDVDFRLFIATREGYICVLRRGWLEGKILLQTTKDIVDMKVVPADIFVIVATTDKVLTCYTKKGNKLWSLEMKNGITCLCLIRLEHLSTTLLAVGLRGGLIQIYRGRQLVDQIAAADHPSSLTFGKLGQEEHVLVTVTMSGVLDFKILKRTADFNFSQHDGVMSPTITNKPLPLPKRSKLFLEQSARERENAVEMHHRFQQDLIRLRLNVARAIVESQNIQIGVGNEKEMIKLSAQVMGLGPKFTLILNLENMHTEKPLTNTSVVFHCNPSIYRLTKNHVQIPLIPPGLTYKFQTNVEDVCFDENKNVVTDFSVVNNENIKVFCIKDQEQRPLLAATITMPITDVSVALI